MLSTASAAANLSQPRPVSASRSIRLRPIMPADADQVGQFLNANLNGRITPAAWAAAMVPPWQANAPNHGFMLIDGDALVGVHLAFYSQRQTPKGPVRFCNLAAFCVRDTHRLHSLRLLKALLEQPGYVFTDLSPSGNVVPLNRRLGFTQLDTSTALVPNLPWLAWPGSTRVITSPRQISRMLAGEDLRIYRDHARTAAAHHVVLQRGDEHCYVIFRRDRRKRMPLFGSILHVGNRPLFHRVAHRFFAHLLVHHGIAFTLAELRVTGHRPTLSMMLPKPRPKMFMSTEVGAEMIDYLYSELTCVAW